MTKPAGYHDMRWALTQTGCPLCRLLARNADNYIDGVLWELVNDPEIRHNLNQARGYCREHAWLLVRYGASLGVAILMLDVLETVLKVLDEGEFAPPPGFSLQQMWRGRNQQPQNDSGPADLVAGLAPQSPCPVCAQMEHDKAYYLDALLAFLGDGPDSLASAYRASAGLCLPHFRLALQRVPDEETFQNLTAAQNAVWERLKVDLQEFIRKNDYRYIRESFGEEGDAWRRAIEAISGAPPARVKGRNEG